MKLALKSGWLIALICLMAGSATAENVPEDIEALLREAARDDARMAAQAGHGAAGLHGFAQFELARTTSRPVHWSKMLGRIEVGANGRLGEGLKWKLSARADYDAVYDVTDHYPAAVADDQRFNVSLRENYLDVGAGDWDFRLGRQHVIWGEMVGLFFADVVSARDMREFILPEFNLMRIPQWAARAEYFSGDFHGELLWIPVPSYDETGKSGAEFFPRQPEYPGYVTRYRNEQKPSRRPANGNYGLRAGWLKNGWDVSAFYYRSTDATPTFYRTVDGVAGVISYEARHDRISQFGGTLAKDFGAMVLKAEAVYTKGRGLTVLRLADDDGLARQNTLDWVVGFDFVLPAETRLNLQFFQSMVTNARDPDLLQEKRENGYSVFVNGKLRPRLEAEVLWVASLNRSDWMLRPKLSWMFEKNWRLVFGADVFHGPTLGYFGRYSAQDRVYTELRYSY
ncbi:DUF1302 family protein [Sulfuricystis multivorans]|uniref:DUF1302 family protein n=1 Tax=Sulfuricystis multivorans TaxID=2211108 RepID=UPI000F84183F|nr:DUF1302 family protein [Sulfuricystis multivorans]